VGGGFGPSDPGGAGGAPPRPRPQPAGGLPERPGGAPAAAMLFGDVKVADVAPPAVPGQPFGPLEGFCLDVADHFFAQNGRQAGPPDPPRPPGGQPRAPRARRAPAGPPPCPGDRPRAPRGGGDPPPR